MLTALAVLLAASGGDAAPPPNVVLVVVDDLGARDLACYGSDLYETPHADRLAAGGLTFTRAYAAYPRCVPSRVALMTGRYPSRIDPVRGGGGALPPGEVTFGEALRDAGYRTGYVGKWHLGGADRGTGPGDQGFGTVVHAGDAGATGSHFAPFGQEKGHTVAGELTAPPGTPLADRLTDAAVDFLHASEADDRPFLLVLSHYLVHTPLEATDEAKKKYSRLLRRAGVEKGGTRNDPDLVPDGPGAVSKTVQNNPTYAAMVEAADRSLGRVLDTLDELDLAGNTVVILTSDHGGLSTRGDANRRALATSNRPLRRGKGSILEGGLRVPLVVRGPGVPAGRVTDAVTVNVDLFPTLCDLAGVPAPAGLDGVSLAPGLAGGPFARPPAFFYKWQARPDSTGDERALVYLDGDLKLIEWIDRPDSPAELFDVAADPGESRDLAADRPDLAAALRSAAHAAERDVGDRREQGAKSIAARADRKRGRRGGKDERADDE